MINDKEKGAITQGTGRQLEEARPGGFNCKARIVEQSQAHVEAEVIYPRLCLTLFGTKPRRSALGYQVTRISLGQVALGAKRLRNRHPSFPARFESPLIPHLLDVNMAFAVVTRNCAALSKLFSSETQEAGNISTRDTADVGVPRETPAGDQMDFVEVMEIKDGLIQHHRVYWGLTWMRSSGNSVAAEWLYSLRSCATRGSNSCFSLAGRPL
jgi:hypothetical protein